MVGALAGGSATAAVFVFGAEETPPASPVAEFHEPAECVPVACEPVACDPSLAAPETASEGEVVRRRPRRRETMEVLNPWDNDPSPAVEEAPLPTMSSGDGTQVLNPWD